MSPLQIAPISKTRYQMHKFPTSFQAVDNVIIWREASKILLGRKPNRVLWQFPGGFVDPSDQNLETAAERERKEECRIGFDDITGHAFDCICSCPEYIGSFRVQDPRYMDSPDKIMSAIFLSFYITGTPEASDDLQEVRWFDKNYLRRYYVKTLAPIHYPIISLLIHKGYL